MTESTLCTWIEKYTGDDISKIEDMVAIESPLEIQLSYMDMGSVQNRSIAITMRTPGDDVDLAVGFLLAERIVDKVDRIDKIDTTDVDRVVVHLLPDVEPRLEKSDKNFITNSSCGVCGKSSIDSIFQNMTRFPIETSTDFNIEMLYRLPEQLLAIQSNFGLTGGVHAATIFDREGNYIIHKEDVGRHNALDKLIGTCANSQLNLEDKWLLLSGRVSFELMQKANVAGIRNVVALGAPSSLAIEMARDYNMLLIGFLKSNRMNIYHRPS